MCKSNLVLNPFIYRDIYLNILKHLNGVDKLNYLKTLWETFEFRDEIELNKIDWDEYSKIENLPIDILIEFESYWNLRIITEYQTLTENFIQSLIPSINSKINYIKLCHGNGTYYGSERNFIFLFNISCQKLSQEFMQEFIDDLCFDYIIKYQILSEVFIRTIISTKICNEIIFPVYKPGDLPYEDYQLETWYGQCESWYLICEHQNLSEEFMKEMESIYFPLV